MLWFVRHCVEALVRSRFRVGVILYGGLFGMGLMLQKKKVNDIMYLGSCGAHNIMYYIVEEWDPKVEVDQVPSNSSVVFNIHFLLFCC